MLRTFVVVVGLFVVVAIVAARGGLPALPVFTAKTPQMTIGNPAAHGDDQKGANTSHSWISAGLQVAQRAAIDAAGDDATATLVRAIETTQAVSLAAGTEPIPAVIRRKIVGFFPKPMLDEIRYRIGWTEPRPPLAPLFLIPQVKAMTLGRVIVFRDQAAANDVRIWVHELGHVEQYARWGTEGFAERYVRNYKAVEDDAWAVFDRYDAWARAQGRLAATDYEPQPAVR